MSEKILLVASPSKDALSIKPPAGFQILPMELGTRKVSHYFTDVEKLRSNAGPQWDHRCVDLLSVVCALRAADRNFPDGGLFQCVRDIHLAVGVTDPDLWKKATPLLAETVSALSDDRLSFRPLGLTRSVANKLPLQPDPAATSTTCDCTALFSGGADSFCGAVHLLRHGRLPRFVSHSIGPISRRQQILHAALEQRFSQLPSDALLQTRACPRLQTNAAKNPRKWRSRDSLNRLRSLYFLSIAAIAAKSLGVRDVFICENGVIGSAIPFSASAENPHTTRPAESNYLRKLEAFLRVVLSYPIRIRNPFQFMTKGEVLAEAISAGLSTELFATVSCWRSGNQGIKNCGQCVPCMFRQLAFAEAGVARTPKEYKYSHPIPSGPGWKRWDSPFIVRLEEVREFCTRAAKRNGVQWLLGNEPRVIDAVDVASLAASNSDAVSRRNDDSTAPQKTAEMLRRFSQAVIRRLK